MDDNTAYIKRRTHEIMQQKVAMGGARAGVRAGARKPRKTGGAAVKANPWLEFVAFFRQQVDPQHQVPYKMILQEAGKHYRASQGGARKPAKRAAPKKTGGLRGLKRYQVMSPEYERMHAGARAGAVKRKPVKRAACLKKKVPMSKLRLVY